MSGRVARLALDTTPPALETTCGQWAALCVMDPFAPPPALCKGGLPCPAPSRGQEIRDLVLAFKLLLSLLQVRKLRPRERGESLASQSKAEAGTTLSLSCKASP